MFKGLLASIVVVASLSVGDVSANTCTYPSDIASDGSRCGGRASTVKPGGKLTPETNWSCSIFRRDCAK